MTDREIIQQEALDMALQHRRMGCAISMGVGKTYIGLQYINRCFELSGKKGKVLVVAPKLSIFTSWKDDAVKFKLEHLLEHIEFTTYLSIHKQDLDYDIIILDECHNLLMHHSDYLQFFTGRILGLTGTPPKHKSSEKAIMVQRYCPMLYSYITDEAVDANILNDYEIIVHKVPLSEANNMKVTMKNGTFYTSELKSYQYWSKRLADSQNPKQKQINSIMRMKAMMEFPSKETYTRFLMNMMEDKCLLFANSQAQAERLCKHSYHSKNIKSEYNLDLFKQGHIQFLSCVLQLSEGVTVPDLKTSVILHAYGNERKFMQRFGRCLRLHPDETAIIHLLCFKDTVDELWVERALEDLDQSKIKYVEHKLEKAQY